MIIDKHQRMAHSISEPQAHVLGVLWSRDLRGSTSAFFGSRPTFRALERQGLVEYLATPEAWTITAGGKQVVRELVKTGRLVISPGPVASRAR